jgi:small conductance mechanosensitive channel
VQGSASRFRPMILRAALLLGAACAASPAAAQDPTGGAGEPEQREAPGPAEQDLAPAAAQVDVKPASRDEDIGNRLQRVLDATGWFIEPQVRVEAGVVFLGGRARSEELKKWAGDLARSTQDVVAVANRMEVVEPSMWDMRPAWLGLLGLWREFIRSLPFVVFALLVLALSAGAGVLTRRAAQALLRERIRARLLRSVLATAAGVLVFLFGAYVVLRVSGLTQLALTVVGGTGLIGLVLGIAFRDITENFLASIFLSLQQPFETGDLIEVAGVTGYVQQLNIRTTIVMRLDGNLVQIPNASVYKSNIRNFSANCNRREDFVVGIGYEDSISDAQQIARQVLLDHPAVLDDPEPSVLVDGLGKATVDLRVYFWLNGRESSWLKVRSSVIRLVKRAYQEHGISMPDEAREVVFPRGLPITMVEAEAAGDEERRRMDRTGAAPGKRLVDRSPAELDAASTDAEGGLHSEAGVIGEQARQVEPLHEAENLLDGASGAPSAQDEAGRSAGSGGARAR